MKATELVRSRIAYSASAFAEIVVWQLPAALEGSEHQFKYRLAYVVGGECVLRYDNEAGKGDHRHVRQREYAYAFRSLEQLLADFQADVRRVRHEDRDS